MSTTDFNGVRVFDEEPRAATVIGPEAVDGWTEETRHAEAAMLVMLLDAADYESAVLDAKAMLDTEHMAAAVAILEALAVGGVTNAAKVLLAWLDA